MPVLWTYEYFGNATFGRETVLPLLRGLASFFKCWMERHPVAGSAEYVLVDFDDNISEMGWWMGCAEEKGPACTKWQDVIMTIAFLKRLYSTLPVIAEELGQPVEAWWTDMYEHLPDYTRTNIEVCHQAPVGQPHCYNNSKCPVSSFCPPPLQLSTVTQCRQRARNSLLTANPRFLDTSLNLLNSPQCTHARVFTMAANGTDDKGNAEKLPISGYYSGWPVFPAEHLDVDSPGDDGAVASSTAYSLTSVSPTSLAVIDLPASIKMSAGRTAGPVSPLEPGAQPVPLMKALHDWLIWSVSSPRPWGTPWAKDQQRGNLFPFITPNYVGGLEEIGVSMMINDMLLLVTGWPRQDPIIRLFPVWRYAAGAGPASFQKLRSKGAFVVSASYDNVTDEVSDVKIESDAGRPCALLSPWARASGEGAVAVTTATGAEVPVYWRTNDARGAILEWNTSAGGVYSVVPTPLSPTTRMKTDEDLNRQSFPTSAPPDTARKALQVHRGPPSLLGSWGPSVRVGTAPSFPNITCPCDPQFCRALRTPLPGKEVHIYHVGYVGDDREWKHCECDNHLFLRVCLTNTMFITCRRLESDHDHLHLRPRGVHCKSAGVRTAALPRAPAWGEGNIWRRTDQRARLGGQDGNASHG